MSGITKTKQRQFNIYRCPFCLSSLKINYSNNLECSSCNRKFPIKNNIPLLCNNPEYYYGESSKKETRELLSLVEKEKGFDTALRDWLNSFPEKKSDYLIKYILDEKRAGGKYLLDLKGKEKVLDLGCGWGGFLTNIFEHTEEIYGTDLTLERLLFLKYWLEYRKFNNFFLCCSGDTPYFPFPDNYFDIVVMNGVLEWVPTSTLGDPKRLQENFLKETRRVLKRKGQIYFAIENRFGFKYFLGSPDDHSRLKYASLLPRKIANFYSRRIKKKPYRTYTYSYKTYIKLLRKFGFKNISTFTPLPIYRYPKKIVSTVNKKPLLREASPELKTRIKDSIKKNKIFARSFIFITSDDKFHCMIDSILKKEFPGSNYFLSNIRITQTGTFIINLVNPKNNSIEMIMKLPMNDFIEQRLDCYFKNLTYLRSHYSWIKDILPVPIRNGILNNQKYLIESFMYGLEGGSVDGEKREKVILKAINIITQLHKNSLSQTTREEMEIEIENIFSSLGIFNWSLNEKDILLKGRNFLKENIPASPFFVFSHNDYYLGNILLDFSSQKIIGVLDWDLSSKRGFALVDILHLLARSYKDDTDNLISSIQKHIISPLDNDKKFLNYYLKEIKISFEDFKFYLIVYLFLLLKKDINAWKEGIGGIKNLYYSNTIKEIHDFINLLKDVL